MSEQLNAIDRFLLSLACLAVIKPSWEQFTQPTDMWGLQAMAICTFCALIAKLWTLEIANG